MKSARYLIVMGLALVCAVNIGCQRNGDQVWEDTKTGGRYMAKGVKSIFGNRGDSRMIADAGSFHGNQQSGGDFVPLANEEAYRRLANGDTAALDSIPQSSESPGDPGSGIPGIDGFALPTGEAAEVFKLIHFPYDDYNVRSDEDVQTVTRIAAYMKSHPNVYIFVEGHCDERGPAAYNLALGSRRSNNVRTLLVKEGVDLNHIFTISYGKERPLTQGHEEQTWSENRRAAFKVFTR